MKTVRLLTFATAAAIFAGGLIGAPAQTTTDSATGNKPDHGRILQRIAQKLNLTDDQKSQLKAVWNGEKDTVQSLIGQWHDARKNLRTTIHASGTNETAVRAAAARAAAVEADLAVERMKLYGKIAPILTEEQRRKIAGFEQRLDDRISSAIARLGDGSNN
ncbi:MAG TPA: periplasmic heavy metal sensor [Candidatus Acidoferrum sp.]|nr:periplasmic heavy metal sensor [Candidatus Acidoferrum sp.]